MGEREQSVARCPLGFLILGKIPDVSGTVGAPSYLETALSLIFGDGGINLNDATNETVRERPLTLDRY